jgi:cytidine deaminase
MFEKLKELLNNSKSEYYKFRVSAILVCKDGISFNGVNVETSSPNASICAERNALYSAIANGYNKDDFMELHIMVDSNNYSYPCFICRQALNDYMNKDLKIFLYSINKLEKTIILDDLICSPFSKEDLR